MEQSWIETRALLETELENKRLLLVETNSLNAKIEKAKQDVVRAENAVALSLEAVEQAQTNVDVAAEKISDLEDNTPERAFEKAQLAATKASENADAAQAEFERAKKEQKRIEATVAELRRAAKAAQAAANASRVVVSAAESAKQAVADNQDVMADADGPALSNLENDFFADAEQQAVNMEKSAKAASQAVELSELRLASLKRQEEKFRKNAIDVNAIATAADSNLAEVEKEIEAHLEKMQAVHEESEAAQATLRRAKEATEAKKEAMQAAARDVAVFEGRRSARREEIDKAENTLNIVQEKFAETESELKKLHRARAQKNAVAMASVNSNLNEKLRETISGAAPDHPIFDRLVFSSAKLFEQGSSDLGEGGKEVLAKIVPVLEEVVKELPEDLNWVVRVDGHTDNKPLSGTGRFKDNWELSQARALAVVRYLILATSLEPNRLSANGYGEFQPLTSGTSPVSLAKNRRIELTLETR